MQAKIYLKSLNIWIALPRNSQEPSESKSIESIFLCHCYSMNIPSTVPLSSWFVAHFPWQLESNLTHNWDCLAKTRLNKKVSGETQKFCVELYRIFNINGIFNSYDGFFENFRKFCLLLGTFLYDFYDFLGILRVFEEFQRIFGTFERFFRFSEFSRDFWDF